MIVKIERKLIFQLFLKMLDDVDGVSEDVYKMMKEIALDIELETILFDLVKEKNNRYYT